ncbi:glycosyltransferase family 2 protein [Pseudaminobacter sp. 19-2017]|uniref:Glycosyltransferase family 2 protein n=1 Tax=Pseudaminobacter soli (ex Zhang et al. 2022) TaxID=2831468 RepID=A0A942DWW3_9HYPH|nr:glycosyltransferase family A protein [Pseudaminobacter soli]MBS3649419.1 glycosyltransferase family 2 protein [Pseudaminobacter soli]
MAKVQVLVPCYNYGRYLEQSVQSALTQKDVDVDVLIIDDGSSDNTPEICRELIDRDSRVRVIRHERNIGHIATYNEGIAQIRGDYFVMLSADDLLTPGALSRATSLMEAHPSVGMTYGNPISFTDTLREARTSCTGAQVWAGTEWIRKVCRSGKNFLDSPEAVVRADIQRQIGGYDPKLPHSGDMEMWLRIAALSDIGRVRGADQAYYRVHPLSMQRTVHVGFLFDLLGRHQAIQSMFQKEGASLPEREELCSLARRVLARTAIRHARKLCDFPLEDNLPASKYRDFAVSLWPEIVGTFGYHAFEIAERQHKRKSAFQKSVSHHMARLRKFAEDGIFNRVEYRWFRYTGTYFPRDLF